MTEKSKNGAGKFFLGAILGAAAGAIAGKFIHDKVKKTEEDFDETECDCGDECKCGDKCECEKKAEEKTEKPVEEKTEIAKKGTTKKTSEQK